MTEETNWFTEDRATLGDRIAAAREAAGLSQAQLATRLGVRRKTLDAWERDSSEPRANRVQMLAAMLNVSLRWLLSGEGDGITTTPEGAGDMRQIAEALEDLRRMRAQIKALAEGVAKVERRLMSLQEHDDDRK